METYKKETVENYELQVNSFGTHKHAYFLRGFSSSVFSEQLDFFWCKKGKPKASVTFAISGDQAVSLPQAPFGGFWSERNITSLALESFLRAVINYLKQKGITHLEVTQPPKPYEPNSDLINYLLYKEGFVQEKVLSHHFFIGKKKIKKMVQEEQTRYLKSAKEGGLKIQIGSIQNFGFLDEIKFWNQSRGYQILFEDTRLIHQVSEYPDRYFLISVLKEGKAIAHTLCSRLIPDSLYYFLSAIDPKSSVKNVGDLAVFSMFQLAAEQKIEFIDLGSSETEAGVNHSLMFFKSRFSNEISNKVSWKLKI